MLIKREASIPEGEIPQLPDESWWAAVLSDEESYQTPRKETGSRAAAQPTVTAVDWSFVQRVYEQDEIVCLKVHGFNRGGLLVQGCGIQGFVPVSHLIDLPNTAGDEERRSVLAAYVDRDIELKVIECEKAQERIVLSERAALAGEGKRRVIFTSAGRGQFTGLSARQESNHRNGSGDGSQETSHRGVGHLVHRYLLGAG